ncbi:hypothetical protein V5F53_09175 [Xanthobacter sp. V4C-4]|uniref:hypothetical protein n=1 Tax=Xanthobacter cornucopiae TaxID=3119924 RepID=UPI00372BD2B0
MPGDADISSILLPIFVPGRLAGAGAASLSAVPDGDRVQVNEGALLSFGGSVSSQSLEDVSNSILFAQLAADHKFDRKTSPQDWSGTFSNTLSTVGWISQSASADTQTFGGDVNWADVVTSGMPAAVVGLVRKSIGACDRLPADSKAVGIWNDAVSGPADSFFLIGSARRANQALTLSLARASFQSTIEKPSFLAWGIRYPTALTWTELELNEDIYKRVRQSIIDKLGNRPDYLTAFVPLEQ